MNNTILVLEGEKKTACAAKDGFIAFGIGGVDCWQQGGEPLPDLNLFDWAGNDVVLFFDSDYKDNPNVERALIKFARELKRRGSTVYRADPPSGPNGEKWGYDDCRVNLGKKATIKLVEDAEEFEFPPDKIEELNRYHYVAREGSQVRIHDERDGAAISRQDFVLQYMNQYVPDGDGKPKPLADQWLKSPYRRQYTQTIFDPAAPPEPDVYNRYKGFAYEPAPGDWSLLREHIRQIICSGNEEHAEYLLDWLARGVQLPGERAEVAIVLRGEQGTGKGVFFNAYASLFEPYVYRASSTKEITGFNGHLRDKILVFLDEAFFAGDKSHVGALKALITEPIISIEGKYKDSINVKNILKLIIASNEHWVIPAGKLERRFLALDVSAERQQDTSYFRALVDQLHNGGYEAFYFDLLNRNISNFDHRTCPRTAALAEQQLYTMTPVESYWHGILEDGVLPYAKNPSKFDTLVAVDWGHVLKQKLYDDFIDSQHKRRQGHLPDISQFASELGRLLPDGYPKTHRPRVNEKRQYVWEFPPMKTCKRHFEAVRGGPPPKAKKPKK